MKSKVESLIEKSIACAVSSIEIYNKPDFKYREETFTILMVNAWELILKAKKIKENNGNIKVLYIKEFIKNAENKNTKKWKYKKSNISDAFQTISISSLLKEYENNNVLDKRCLENIRLLEDIRNNSVHLLNKDQRLDLTVYELGTATLKNYVTFIKKYFNKDLSKYNFYLMPLSFYVLENVVENINISQNDYVQNLRNKILELQKKYKSNPNDEYNILLSTSIAFVKSKDKYTAINVVKDKKEDTLDVRISDEEINEKYPLTYLKLVEKLRARYKNFNQNAFNRINKEIREKSGNAYCRYLDTINKKGNSKWFYNANIIPEFDRYFEMK